MSIPVVNTPPDSRTSYVLPQLAGEKITLPGWKGVFRILASSKQTNGGLAVMAGASVLADAPGFHWHEEAHDIFMVIKGYVKLWVGDKCRILAPGDFAYAPPKVVHNPQWIGPHTESFCLVAPGDWVDFFRFSAMEFDGLILPENSKRDEEKMIAMMLAAKDKFDVHYIMPHHNYQPPELGDWLETENKLGEPLQPYFLRGNTGPRWMSGGVMSRPFILASQNGGRFAISSIESSSTYKKSIFESYVKFATVDHCLFMVEGKLKVELQGSSGVNELHDGETVVISAGQGFKLDFASPFVKFFSVANGRGIETLIQDSGKPFEGLVLPDKVGELESDALARVANEIDATIE
ncbi:RmlC-like cupin domain-containing protein [Fusarium flagelliforme]|uniref:Putative dioxygenase n=1 Tax=Fusarium flagelliforme TaxID=2675880 RepID=A0A395N1H4_9HYPO|nr:RmlC-like cupin domain-containing protein [Fusarium flagelliforme]KAH7173233.1 RmlC-like cupin domain-containing protein [Fusarium flagelliforme]RFN53976.1 putative dioxygenase [Fusarium flagelliforme]